MKNLGFSGLRGTQEKVQKKARYVEYMFVTRSVFPASAVHKMNTANKPPPTCVLLVLGVEGSSLVSQGDASRQHFANGRTHCFTEYLGMLAETPASARDNWGLLSCAVSFPGTNYLGIEKKSLRR